MDSQRLRSIEEYCWWWCKGAYTLEMTLPCLTVVVLYYPRVFTSRLTDDNMSQANGTLIRHCWYTTSDTDQQTKFKVTERHPHLGNNHNGRSVASLMETSDDHVMANNATKMVDIMVGIRLRQGLVIFVKHIDCRELFYFQ
ncbi:hypothetical protein S40288_11483 [Stachybotrys chartarum IBT 40288]|nr:hypothetical protein S40288_11483 [Stachybotrys chartarum IBT 40288]